MQRAYFDSDGATFIAADPAAIFGHLAQRLPFDLVQAQTGAWQFQMANLQAVLVGLPDAHVFLEFAIPRMGRRADAVIVASGLVFVIEYKVGERDFPRHAIEQAHG